MQDESDGGLHRTSREDADGALNARCILTDRAHKRGQRTLADWLVDGDTHGAIPVVARQEDDGVGETGITHHRCRDQKLSGQRGISGRDLRYRKRRRANRFPRDPSDQGDSGASGQRVGWTFLVFHVKHRIWPLISLQAHQQPIELVQVSIMDVH
jgi:hypothetical protein